MSAPTVHQIRSSGMLSAAVVVIRLAGRLAGQTATTDWPSYNRHPPRIATRRSTRSTRAVCRP
jgi:hypothetical protein